MALGLRVSSPVRISTLACFLNSSRLPMSTRFRSWKNSQTSLCHQGQGTHHPGRLIGRRNQPCRRSPERLPKTGQRVSPENRPTGVASGLGSKCCRIASSGQTCFLCKLTDRGDLAGNDPFAPVTGAGDCFTNEGIRPRSELERPSGGTTRVWPARCRSLCARQRCTQLSQMRSSVTRSA